MNREWQGIVNIVKLLLLFTFFLASCSDSQSPTLTPFTKDAVILAYGDSLTFGIGTKDPHTQSYPSVLQQLTGVSVVNAGISGEVTATALQRLPTVLNAIKPNLVILCHGGNDLIRRLGDEQLKSNLDKMINLIQNSGAEVVLMGVPSFNLTLSVPDLYSELAEKYNIASNLETLPSIERNSKLKSDQIHPNVEGYQLMAKGVYSLLSDAGALQKD